MQRKRMQITTKNGYAIVRDLRDYRYYVMRGERMIGWAVDYSQALLILNEVSA